MGEIRQGKIKYYGGKIRKGNITGFKRKRKDYG